MNQIIVAKDRSHLRDLIKEEIDLNGMNCDLNHIDVSKVENMSSLFYGFNFNGDISQWDVSKVTDMSYMFEGTSFNGDISNWDVSSVEDMRLMFKDSNFDQDISNWNINSVDDMDFIFQGTAFSKDLSNWKPYKLQKSINTFFQSKAPIPYWAGFDSNENIINSMNSYELQKELAKELSSNEKIVKKIKV